MAKAIVKTRCEWETDGKRCMKYAEPDSLYCSEHQMESAPTEAKSRAVEDQNGGLADELDHLIDRVKRTAPDYIPPPFTPRRLVDLVTRNLDKLSPELKVGILERMRKTINQDLMDADTWKGIWYMLNYALEYEGDLLKRRLTGDYETDEWGLDREFFDAVLPFFKFLYTQYWRVEMSGLENIPEQGRGLLVSNHSGQLPWDGSMVGYGVYSEHPAHRLVRSLYASWFPSLPFFSDMFTKMGQVLATEENGTRLLEQDEMVAVYPEGYKGVGKLYKERYQLARFGRGGFVRMALKTGAPIIPLAVVGAEETYISLHKSPTLAKLTGFPYFPLSPTFPWLGLLGFVPLPTKWYIDICEPIPVDAHGPEAADDILLVTQLTDRVREIVQETIHSRLEKRRSVFLG